MAGRFTLRSRRRTEIAVWLLGGLDAAIAALEWRVADEIVAAIEALAHDGGCDGYLEDAYGRIAKAARRDRFREPGDAILPFKGEGVPIAGQGQRHRRRNR